LTVTPAEAVPAASANKPARAVFISVDFIAGTPSQCISCAIFAYQYTPLRFVLLVAKRWNLFPNVRPRT
jgi:hypothetical protein